MVDMVVVMVENIDNITPGRASELFRASVDRSVSSHDDLCASKREDVITHGRVGEASQPDAGRPLTSNYGRQKAGRATSRKVPT